MRRGWVLKGSCEDCQDFYINMMKLDQAQRNSATISGLCYPTYTFTHSCLSIFGMLHCYAKT